MPSTSPTNGFDDTHKPIIETNIAQAPWLMMLPTQAALVLTVVRMVVPTTPRHQTAPRDRRPSLGRTRHHLTPRGHRCGRALREDGRPKRWRKRVSTKVQRTDYNSHHGKYKAATQQRANPKPAKNARIDPHLISPRRFS